MTIKVYNLIPFTGYGYSFTKRMNSSGKEDSIHKNWRIIESIKEKDKKILKIYNSNGQIIEYDKHGKHLDNFA